MKDAFSLACGYGRTAAVEFLLDHAVAADEELHGHGEGHTGLHVAAFHGHVAAVEALLRWGARVDAIDKTWGTPPLIWALTGWTRKETTRPVSPDRREAGGSRSGRHAGPDRVGPGACRSVTLAALEGRLPASPKDAADRTAR